ncbi:DUF2254 domain-containing protein [Streptomyces caeni]|uniref:DUF2254 domain-containing protein n=1 Tax=Streptomyces caeni TaxID=2307231 RepID=A0ABW4IWI4_9ACTN
MREAFRSQLWPLPTLGIVVAVAAGVALPELDKSIRHDMPQRISAFLFSGGAQAARSVLETIAGSLISVTALTFSLTVVALQLASSQFSPRLLRTFSADRYVQATLTLFLTTFTYALTVLRTVHGGQDEQTEFVPQLSVSMAFLLTLASVLSLVLFLSHLARELRVEMMLVAVHREAQRSIDRVLGHHETADAHAAPPSPPDGALPVLASRSGFLTGVDEKALLQAAVDADAVVLIDRPPGSFLIAGTPCGYAWRRGDTSLPARGREDFRRCVADAIMTGPERTDEQDIAFPLRQLTDVAVKALSPGINDPATAVHALSYTSALLCALASRRLGPRLLHEDEQTLRVILNRPYLSDLLQLAVSQPLRYGAAEPEILARVSMMMCELAWTAPPGPHSGLSTQLERLRATLAAQSFVPEDRHRINRLIRQAEQAIQPH